MVIFSVNRLYATFAICIVLVQQSACRLDEQGRSHNAITADGGTRSISTHPPSFSMTPIPIPTTAISLIQASTQNDPQLVASIQAHLHSLGWNHLGNCFEVEATPSPKEYCSLISELNGSNHNTVDVIIGKPIPGRSIVRAERSLRLKSSDDSWILESDEPAVYAP
jgi:hypothetical protein